MIAEPDSNRFRYEFPRPIVSLLEPHIAVSFPSLPSLPLSRDQFPRQQRFCYRSNNLVIVFVSYKQAKRSRGIPAVASIQLKFTNPSSHHFEPNFRERVRSDLRHRALSRFVEHKSTRRSTESHCATPILDTFFPCPIQRQFFRERDCFLSFSELRDISLCLKLNDARALHCRCSSIRRSVRQRVSSAS